MNGRVHNVCRALGGEKRHSSFGDRSDGRTENQKQSQSSWAGPGHRSSRAARPPGEQLARRQPAGEPRSAARPPGSYSRHAPPAGFQTTTTASPHSLRPAPATGGGRRLIGRDAAAAPSLAAGSPALFRARRGLHFVGKAGGRSKTNCAL